MTYIEHFGVKGMHWGVRKEKSNASKKHSFSKKKAAVIIGSAVGIAAIAIGAAYAQRYLGSVPDLKISDVHIPEAAKKFSSSMAKEPVGIVHAARGRSKGWTFPQHGGLSNPISEYDKAGFSKFESETTLFHRYGDRQEKVAARFVDPYGRKDFSGRPILHEVMLPESLAKNANNLSEAIHLAWPLIKDTFQALYES